MNPNMSFGQSGLSRGVDSRVTLRFYERGISMQEFISIAVLTAVVVILAYVARRSQVVGLPPGASKDNSRDSRPSGATHANRR
jgi:hypothetical protein